MLRNTPLKELFFSRKDYFNVYLEEDVKIKNFCNIQPSHYFNDIPYTKWPFYIGTGTFFLLFYFVLAMKQFEFGVYYSLISLVCILYYTYCWLSDIVIESLVFGRYNRKVRASIAYGFMLFLVSEAFVFLGFFWTYFDRLMDPSVLTGGSSLPYGIEPLFKNLKPFYATLTLVLSGYCANWGIYLMHASAYFYAHMFSFSAICLGLIFLFVQISEYNSLIFTITDSVYGSCFYLLTGFHGLHVIIGLIFLSIQHERIVRCHFNRVRMQGYRLAVIYWHFVDYIWILLFLSVYMVNWNYSYFYMWH
jgi:heme/copper-type cytochrome/quinol oxidase subunit 3